MPKHDADLAFLFAAIESDTQAVLLYGPRSTGKSTLLRNLLSTAVEGDNCIPVMLNVGKSLQRSRAEVITEFATRTVEAAGLPHSLLDDFSPNHFHKEFLERLLPALPPFQRLLFVFDDIDLGDRTQLSKLNNLILPLLRRLAPLERLKFILAVDDINPEKMRTLVQPIFTTIEEIEHSHHSLQNETEFFVNQNQATGEQRKDPVLYQWDDEQDGESDGQYLQREHGPLPRKKPVTVQVPLAEPVEARLSLRQAQGTAERLQKPKRLTPLGRRQNLRKQPQYEVLQTEAQTMPPANPAVDNLAVDDFYRGDLYDETYELQSAEGDSLVARVLLLLLLIVVILFLLFNIWLMLPESI